MVVNVILILMVVGIAGALVMMRMKPKQQQPAASGAARRPAPAPAQARQQPMPQQRPQPRPAPAAPLRQSPIHPAQAPACPPVAPYPPVGQAYPATPAYPSVSPAAPSPFVSQQPVQPAVAPTPAGRLPQGTPTAVLSAPAPMLLEVTAGPGKGIPYMLMQGDNHMGRALACQIRLTDSTVSNQHAIVRITPGQITLFDNASTNGTFVNGQRVLGPIFLKEGDQITLGQTTLTLRTQVVPR